MVRKNIKRIKRNKEKDANKHDFYEISIDNLKINENHLLIMVW
jgi:hypothetical protein